MRPDRFRTKLFASALSIALLSPAVGLAQQPGSPDAGSVAAAGDIADFFRKVGDQIYQEDCIFELSEEQLEIQKALIAAYVKHGADTVLARQLAAKQIRPPKLSEKCQQMKSQSKTAVPPFPVATSEPPKKPAPESPAAKKDRQREREAETHVALASLAGKKVLPQWDCDSSVEFVTVQHKGYERKLTDGEICNPFEDVVRPVPEAAKSFRIGYTIRTGRLFVISDDAQVNGRTIAWAISGRDICRNNPDPDCLAARAVGPLPPGEYAFASSKEHRVNWGPKTKRLVAGIFLTKLWNKEKYTPAQTKAILARGNIAIHVRLKGEMSEACLGLGHNGWAYVSNLIKEERATGVSVYIDEPHQQIAEKPPVIRGSSFSMSSLFK